MAHTEFTAPKTIQGEAFTHHAWCETHQGELTKETISAEHLADCQGLLPTGAQDSSYGMLGRAFGDCMELAVSSLKEIMGMCETWIFRGWNKGEERGTSRWTGEEQECKNRDKRGRRGLVMCKQVGRQCTCLAEPCTSSPQSN